jgi:hypothetical protein
MGLGLDYIKMRCFINDYLTFRENGIIYAFRTKCMCVFVCVLVCMHIYMCVSV